MPSCRPAIAWLITTIRRHDGLDRGGALHAGDLIGQCRPADNSWHAPNPRCRAAAPAGDHGRHVRRPAITEWNIQVDPEGGQRVFTAWAGQRQLPRVRFGSHPAGRDDTGHSRPAGVRLRLVSVMRVIEDALQFYFSLMRRADMGTWHICTCWPAAVAMDWNS